MQKIVVISVWRIEEAFPWLSNVDMIDNRRKYGSFANSTCERAV